MTKASARACSAILFAVLACLAGASQAADSEENRAIAEPPEIVDPMCFAMDAPTHTGALLIEEIEGDAIDGFGYGTVHAESGESWGYSLAVSGQQDRAILDLTVSTLVEGDEQELQVQWAFVNGGIVTDMGTYLDADCAPIQEEFNDRFTQ